MAWTASFAADTPAPEGCERLRSIHVVSPKGQDDKLFQTVVAIATSSMKRPFDGAKVFRQYAACLEALQTGGRGDDPAVTTALRRLRLTVDERGSAVSARVDERPGRAFGLGSSPERVVPKLIARVSKDLALEGPDRAAAENALWFLAFESYVRSLGSPWNSYRYFDQLAEDDVDRLGRRYSVGFDLTRRDGAAVVGEVLDPGLPGRGLKPGARVDAIDGKALDGLSPTETDRYWLSMRPFDYRVTGATDGTPFDLSAHAVPRREATIRWATSGDLAYLRISRFAVESVVELRRALRAVERAGARGLVVDVRSNPGGAASPAMIDCFLKPGQTTMSYRDMLTGKEVDVDATVEFHAIPLVVLVDGDSVSMAETFAAAMKTHKRGALVGTTTLGKGVGQTVHEVLDEGRLWLVERTYFYPGTRDSWDGHGITPDIVVEPREGETERLRTFLRSGHPRIDEAVTFDPALAKALELLGDRR